ncbi:MAG: sugar phosphate nucleotidyltransferase [Haloferacaceae archaeon]
MHAVVPAAGEGTRLRPLTDEVPKGLVEVAGKPLLSHVFDALRGISPDGVVVVVGYRGEAIVDHYGRSYRGVPITYVEQEERRGLADAVLRAEPAVPGPFVHVNGDNVLRGDLAPLVERHRATDAAATCLVTEVDEHEARRGGVCELDDDGGVVGFVEKPADPPSTLALAGAYVLSPLVFPACRLVSPADTGEYELSDALDLLCAAGRPVEVVEFSGRRWNVNAPADVERVEARLRSE